MRARITLFSALLCIAIAGPPSLCAFRPLSNKQETRLAAKIARAKNPGKKARLQIRLARAKLMDAIQAYNGDHFSEGLALLHEYRRQINLSWETLQRSKRGVSKHLRACMKLEISLREDGRMLEDLRRRVPYPANEPIKRISEESSRVHRQVLGVLFPPGTPPQENPKGRERGALAATSTSTA